MNFQSKKTMPRYFLVVLMLTLAGVSAVCKSVYIMTVERERWMTMGKIPVKLGRPLYAKRGNILAANGEILAASLPEYELRLDYMSSEKDTAIRRRDQYRSTTTSTPSARGCTGFSQTSSPKNSRRTCLKDARRRANIGRCT